MSVTNLGQELATLVRMGISRHKFNIAVARGETLAEVLRTLPSTSTGQSCDLRLVGWSSDTVMRVWLSRCGLADGEPFENTVYLEEYSEDRWVDLGYFDGDVTLKELV